ncbi:hypothetical protein MGSAQ_001529 [marine sediment metagenome]|uniref:Uncharacterized protein n=1 Tax=marine sediment metagenome TaxID=412755 RepID=A0A1B6NU30_9ZZZZ
MQTFMFACSGSGEGKDLAVRVPAGRVFIIQRRKTTSF